MAEERVILVNERNEEVGTMEKMEAHKLGKLHRAFSVFIFNSEGEMMMQQRAFGKYHSEGLWSNACCSHPRPGEDLLDAAARRMVEEIGFSVTLEELQPLLYRTEYQNGLTEHEFDHVLVGKYDGPVIYNTDEVNDVRFVNMEEVKQSLIDEPTRYTSWFKLAFETVYDWWKYNYAATFAK